MGVWWSSNDTSNNVTTFDNTTNNIQSSSVAVFVENDDDGREKQYIEAGTEITGPSFSDINQDLHLSHEELRQRDNDIARLNRELEATKEEKNKLLIRLSAMAGAKLTDNNPNITDLSDRNRPTKLAEKYTELYDNEWTEAFAFFTDVCGKQEEESIKMLLEALKETYTICETYTTSKTSNIMTAISDFQQSETPSSEVMKFLKDDRKQHNKLHLEKFKKSMRGELKALRADVQSKDKEQKQFKHYISKCADLCFLMTIQDPPVVLNCQNVNDGQSFDKDIYRDYTVRGKKIKFIVWPAIYLHSGGPVLAKGVAQCHKRKRRSSSTTNQSDLSHSNITTYPVEYIVENGERGHMVGTASRRVISIGIDNLENVSNCLPGDVTRITPSNSLLVRPNDKTNHYDTTDTPTDQPEESATIINEDKQNSIMVQICNNIPPVNHNITHV